jgi:hypothetical protein
MDGIRMLYNLGGEPAQMLCLFIVVVLILVASSLEKYDVSYRDLNGDEFSFDIKM